MKLIPTTKIKVTVICLLFANLTFSQTIGTFNSVAPTAQTAQFVFPSTHTFQRIIKSGDGLSSGGTLGINLDFTGYVPISGSNTNGYLSISSESSPAACAILGVSYSNATHVWTVNNGGNVSLPVADIGNTSRFCSGTVTPNNTIIVSEEDVSGADANGDGYTDLGWLIEINPSTRTVINQDATGGVDKLWAIGRSNHENATIKTGNQVLYTGADDPSVGYLYKFIANTPGNFSTGTLYVLQTTGALGNGTWRQVANTTQADRNNTRALSTAQGAYNFNGIEDVEIGPDGKIYLAAKAEGKIYRLTDNGTFGTATDVSALEVFAGNSAYPTITNYDVDGAGPFGSEPWGDGNDNMAFDGEGNLWVLQDGSRNHIWVISPAHTQASPQVKLFATTPAGCEPTGITFTPNYRYMFLSFQHPSGANSTSQTDAAGNAVIFNTHTTVVVARVEHLGLLSVLPVSLVEFKGIMEGNTTKLSWITGNEINTNFYDVEYSTDGTNYSKTGTIPARGNNNSTTNYFFQHNNLSASINYYRLKAVDNDGKFTYSKILMFRSDISVNAKSVYPNPFLDYITVSVHSDKKAVSLISLTDYTGRVISSKNVLLEKGINTFSLDNLPPLPKGIYIMSVYNNESKTVLNVLKK
jgi:uncharacterized protein